MVISTRRGLIRQASLGGYDHGDSNSEKLKLGNIERELTNFFFKCTHYSRLQLSPQLSFTRISLIKSTIND